MASDAQFNINTAEITAISTNIKNINESLCNELNKSKKQVDSLEQYWNGGEASVTTVTNFNKFYTKYFESYRNTIEDYCKYLNQIAVEHTVKTDTAAKEVADVGYFI